MSAVPDVVRIVVVSFHAYARRVRRDDLPFAHRRGAFRSCVECYHWLTRQGFEATYTRYREHFGFDADAPDAGQRLIQAMDALDAERHLFLERLRLFERRRCREKMRGRRAPSKEAVESLYADIVLVVPYEKPDTH